MPKISDVTSIEVQLQGNRTCIRFLTSSARYHVWADAETLEVGAGGASYFGTMKNAPVLYKNSLVEDHRAEGYSACQYLKLSVPANRKLVDAVIQRVRDEGLIEAALQAQTRAEQERIANIFREDAEKGRTVFGRVIEEGEAEGLLTKATADSIRELMEGVKPESWAALTRAFMRT
ncbi:hypothetical protein CcrColossus_gp345 [Caulobacter phage CcrColossus]|uniref:Uncharacterized protein n=1 Tax=Caulobacter phage CcrColossus TaxID=1211640 RepID=K4JV27_9CAUD|nr:hypothetical protein CcrColossus_gp345 [Caulobacter phage CcrColossus]AFU88215.1 hypothetical protein CcrColossus_gp345 [Caulobacter phage CcrColossus]